MSAELTDRLGSATPEGGAPDTEAILARARQLKRRRRTLTGTLGLLALVVVAVPVLGQFGLPDVVLDGRGAPVDWPIEVRYEIERFSEPGQEPVTELHEFGGTSWDEWVAVGVRAPGGDGQVQRFTHGRVYRGEVVVADTAGEPFASLARARAHDLDADDLHDDGLFGLAPNDVMSPGLGSDRTDDGDVRMLDGDLLDLRARVAAEHGLDPDTLLAQRIEEGCVQPNPQACVEVVYVALAAARIPLYAEQTNVETGLEARLRVTHLRAPDPVTEPQVAGAVLDLPPVGQANAEWLDDGTPVFVARHDDRHVSVVLALSTHTPAWGFDKMIGWCPSSRTFEDVQHGSQWNAHGTYLGGPAPTGLVTFTATVRDDGVHVGPRQPPNPRSTGPGEHQPAGPSCVWAGEAAVAAGDTDDPPGVAHEPDDAPLPVLAPESVGDHTVVLVEGTAVFPANEPIRICSRPSLLPTISCSPDSPTVVDAAGPEQPPAWSVTGTFLARAGQGQLRRVATFVEQESNVAALPLDELHGGVTHLVIQGQPVFVAMRGDAVTVFRAHAQHLDGEELWWCPQEEVFVSPAHGDLFDADGRLWDGPAARGLDRFDVEVIDELAMVDTHRVLEGEPRRDDATAAGLLQGQALEGYRNPPWPENFCHDPVKAPVNTGS